MAGKLGFGKLKLAKCFFIQILAVAVFVTSILGLNDITAYADVSGRGEGDHQFLSFSRKANSEFFVHEQNNQKQKVFLPGIDYSFRWRVENGGAQAITPHAIVQGQIIWNIHSNTYLPLPTTPGGRARLSELSEESWSQLALYDVKLKLILREKDKPGQRYGLVLDLGIPNKPGEKSWSITVPEQVSWNKLFTRYEGPGQNNTLYLSSEEARAVVGAAGEDKELVVESSWLTSARMSTVAYFDDLLQKRVDWRAEFMVRTIQAQLDSLERITGLPGEKIRQALAVTRVDINRNITAIPMGVQKLYDKLNSGLPDRYISPMRRAYYHAERTRIYEESLTELEKLKPGQLIDDYPAWFDAKVQAIGLQ
ncbi:hypothetical protein WH96_04905 [Kiloniella spongiae]|uniref:Uncharacterized protein n=1 Tax=Kiloniella spongiae TaxID=1489064 RepID=A0A0H2MH07_9PROT|nr:hypothetical protein [Kiloniella spongiae]KLN61678.1 hypothetical protein WH96_04905 [Kiloniella spongiae]